MCWELSPMYSGLIAMGALNQDSTVFMVPGGTVDLMQVGIVIPRKYFLHLREVTIEAKITMRQDCSSLQQT